jgi:prepilin-type N-terminal cleavage/methylation domain-containing protein
MKRRAFIRPLLWPVSDRATLLWPVSDRATRSTKGLRAKGETFGPPFRRGRETLAEDESLTRMKRRGFTLWETLIALLVLSALTTLCLQFFAAVNDQRRQVFAHLTATQEAANLLERAEALNWDELTTTSAAKLQLSAQARQTLPEGRVAMLVDGPSGTPLARRVAACVRWRPQPGEPEREVRLVAWRYKNP